jgi:hypothetical protein
MTFDLSSFRQEFALVMSRLRMKMEELDRAGSDLHQRVNGFSSRAL